MEPTTKLFIGIDIGGTKVAGGLVDARGEIHVRSRQTADKLLLLTAEADSIPGPILEIGNTNRRYRFPIGARRFIEKWHAEGPAHHCAIGVGHTATKLKKLAVLLGMDCVQIC